MCQRFNILIAEDVISRRRGYAKQLWLLYLQPVPFIGTGAQEHAGEGIPIP
jgi:hypothetical protein